MDTPPAYYGLCHPNYDMCHTVMSFCFSLGAKIIENLQNIVKIKTVHKHKYSLYLDPPAVCVSPYLLYHVYPLSIFTHKLTQHFFWAN